MAVNPEPSFQDLVEARYHEWEQEFGDEIEAKRTHAWTPKN